MALTSELLEGQSVETIKGALNVWKMIQSSPGDDFTKDEADTMVKFLSNELKIKECL